MAAYQYFDEKELALKHQMEADAKLLAQPADGEKLFGNDSEEEGQGAKVDASAPASSEAAGGHGGGRTGAAPDPVAADEQVRLIPPEKEALSDGLNEYNSPQEPAKPVEEAESAEAMDHNHKRHPGNYDYSDNPAEPAEEAKPAEQAKEPGKVLYFAEPLTGRSSAEVLPALEKIVNQVNLIFKANVVSQVVYRMHSE